MKKLVSVKEMISIEHEADRSGLSYSMMMENAGLGLAKVVHERYQYLQPGPVLGLVGSGNNGGDTLVALTHLANWGWQACAYIARPRQVGDPLMMRLTDAGGIIIDGDKDQNWVQLKNEVENCSLLLDGVLGTGIQLPLRGKVAEILAIASDLLTNMDQAPTVVAVDCPSGVDCDSGEAAPECIPADFTVTMAAVKRGLLAFPAYSLVGDLELVGIGLADELELWNSISRFVVDRDNVISKLPERKLNAHKGTFGTALVIAGSTSYTGAAFLAGQAAYRSGAGLVTLAIPAPLHAVLAGQFPEATWLPLPHVDGAISSAAVEVVLQNLDRPTAVLIGPGFGMAETTSLFLHNLLNGQDATLPKTQPSNGNRKSIPNLVIDADGLKLLASIPEWQQQISGQAVLTPHPGEMSVLTGMPVSEIQADRLGVAEHFARKWGHVVVLKGAFTVIASPEGQTGVIPVATPALARAGTGDVLAGLIVGLRAQGVDGFNAALIGSWIHAQAGLRAAAVLGSTTSVIAGDVLQGVVDVIATLSR